MNTFNNAWYVAYNKFAWRSWKRHFFILGKYMEPINYLPAQQKLAASKSRVRLPQKVGVAIANNNKSCQKIKRIKIASQTISNLYEDLTYLVLSHQTMSQNEEVDLKILIEETP